MGTNNNQGKGSQGNQHMHDGQKNYANNNQRNRDNIRDNTRDKQYKEHDETLTNDALYNDKQQLKVDAEFDDKKQNVEKDNSPND